MLSPIGVHDKGEIIYKIGADRKQLSSSVCVELAPSGPTRVANITANETLIKKSKGLLAPLNGEEWGLTLGCGHTAAFCKVAPLKGPTPKKGLQDELGNVDYVKLTKQSEYKTMMEIGWDWQVIPWDVDMMFPRFAKATQKALNGQNSASTEIGELDTAINFADLMTEMSDDPEWEKNALKSVQDMCMGCAGYCKIILDFVKLYGGGAGVPHITFMDSIGKAFNANMQLGEQFWRAITYTTYVDKTSIFPLLRLALAIVNLTCHIEEQRVAKLLKKEDVARTATQVTKVKANEAEAALQGALQIVELLGFSITDPSTLRDLGQFFVRVGLWVTGKGKQGREGKDYALPQIKAKFLDAIGKVVGKTINFDPWGPVSRAADISPEKPAVCTAEPAHSLHSLSDVSSATWKLKQKKFEVGSYCQERGTPDKDEDGKRLMMQITSIDDATETVHVKQVVPWHRQDIKCFEGTVGTV